MEYFKLLNEIEKAYRKEDYKKMLEFCEMTLPLLPKFVEKEKKQGGDFDVKSIPALENGCLFWAILNQRTMLDSVKKLVESIPELQKGWGWKVRAAIEMEELSRQIQEYVKEHPGIIQSKLKTILGKEANDVSIVAYYLAKFGMIERVKSGGSYQLFIGSDRPQFNKPIEGDLVSTKHPAVTQKRDLEKKQADVDVISDFYVYLHKDPKTGIPFYVGRGRANRAYDRTSRHKEWHDFVKTIGGKFKVEIVERNLRESDAGEIERNLIAKYGKKRDGAGPLVNWTDGGEDEVGITMGIDISDLLSPEFKEQEKKKYGATVYRVLLGEERERFVKEISQILESLLDDLNDIPGEEDEWSSLEVTLNTLDSHTLKFSERRISSQDMAFYIDREIESLQLDLEYADPLRKELEAILKRAIRELREIRGELTPK
jgi:hypothetical protein